MSAMGENKKKRVPTPAAKLFIFSVPFLVAFPVQLIGPYPVTPLSGTSGYSMSREMTPQVPSKPSLASAFTCGFLVQTDVQRRISTKSTYTKKHGSKSTDNTYFRNYNIPQIVRSVCVSEFCQPRAPKYRRPNPGLLPKVLASPVLQQTCQFAATGFPSL